MMERRGSQHNNVFIPSHGRSKSHGANVGIPPSPGAGLGMGMGMGMGGVPMSPAGSAASPIVGAESEWADIQAR